MNHISEIYDMNFGHERRKRILQFIKYNRESSFPGLTVNTEHCLIIKQDNDLQYLLKKGILKMVRIDRTSGRCRRSYLTLAKD